MITDLGFISAGEQASEDLKSAMLFQRPKRQKSQQNSRLAEQELRRISSIMPGGQSRWGRQQPHHRGKQKH